MKIPVFLSYPKPFMKKQSIFIDHIKNHLHDIGLEPRTLGTTDYDMDEPLTAIRRLMLESNGILTIAFRKSYIKEGCVRPSSDLGKTPDSLDNMWFTSPYSHIEPAMAFQIGLPTIIFREKGVVEEGILEKGVIGTYMPEFNLEEPIDEYFKSEEWKQLIKKWELQVHRVYAKKGMPDLLY